MLMARRGWMPPCWNYQKSASYHIKESRHEYFLIPCNGIAIVRDNQSGEWCCHLFFDLDKPGIETIVVRGVQLNASQSPSTPPILLQHTGSWFSKASLSEAVMTSSRRYFFATSCHLNSQRVSGMKECSYSETHPSVLFSIS